jgi:hypothetical protein
VVFHSTPGNIYLLWITFKLLTVEETPSSRKMLHVYPKIWKLSGPWSITLSNSHCQIQVPMCHTAPYLCSPTSAS